MAKIDPPEEASLLERMDGRRQLLSSNKLIHYFKEWTNATVFKKNIYLQKFDAWIRWS